MDRSGLWVLILWACYLQRVGHGNLAFDLRVWLRPGINWEFHLPNWSQRVQQLADLDRLSVVHRVHWHLIWGHSRWLPNASTAIWKLSPLTTSMVINRRIWVWSHRCRRVVGPLCTITRSRYFAMGLILECPRCAMSYDGGHFEADSEWSHIDTWHPWMPRCWGSHPSIVRKLPFEFELWDLGQFTVTSSVVDDRNTVDTEDSLDWLLLENTLAIPMNFDFDSFMCSSGSCL